MDFVKIKAGSFIMGADLSANYLTAKKGIFIQDEFPARKVNISYDFEMAKFEVTNALYEKYDPNHRHLRGKAVGISNRDDEPVVYVSWDDAMNFCADLSSQDPKYNYRLPTEAEWEYACRAGTQTPYYDGVDDDIYAMNPLGPLAEKQRILTEWVDTGSNETTNNIAWRALEYVDLTPGREGPNPWGLYDLMGNVQEWCLDWYGPYNENDLQDPVGYVSGDSKVVRGGSHHTYIQTHRSANRSSSNRSDAHFLLGFRLVRVPKEQNLPKPYLLQPIKRWAQSVTQTPIHWTKDTPNPVFKLQSLYTVATEYDAEEMAQQFRIPLYYHNHSPALTWCDNGDILLIWFSGEIEKGQELTILGLRGRHNAQGGVTWDTEVSEFFKEADRNMHGSHLWNNAMRRSIGIDEPFTLYHLNGLCTDGRWARLAQTFRKSTDFGATWSEPIVIKKGIDAFHLESNRNQPQGNAFVMTDGSFISFSDGSAVGGTGSSVNLSRDGGKTWTVHTQKEGPVGIHVSGVELIDGHIMTFSRDQGKHFGSMPKSFSSDHGKSFTSQGSEFPPLYTRQRSELLRLRYSEPTLDPEGLGRQPILLVSIASEGMEALDANGNRSTVYGSFAAISWDEGETWPVKRVLSDVKQSSQTVQIGPWNDMAELDATHGQIHAYWAGTQSPDGLIYLSDGKLMYTFNLAWLMFCPSDPSSVIKDG